MVGDGDGGKTDSEKYIFWNKESLLSGHAYYKCSKILSSGKWLGGKKEGF